MDHRCPNCHQSLRFRSMPEHEVPRSSRAEPSRWYKHCVHCQTRLIERRHPAFANNWLWGRFILPSMLLCGAGIFWWPPLLFVAVPGMVLGFLLAVAYTIRERLTFQVFVPLDFVDDATKDDRLF